jgi:hypothetical protein
MKEPWHRRLIFCLKSLRVKKQMTTYVLGAGASYPVYPLASKLLAAVNDFIVGCGKLIDRFDYEKWPEVLGWLENNSNPLLRQAFQNGNIEQIFTILDLADSLHDDSQIDILRASKQGMEAVNAAKLRHEGLAKDTTEYHHIKRTLMWALEQFFQDGHHRDYQNTGSKEWSTLNQFADLVQPRDTVVTFNYDSTIERVLLERKKWFPSNGYGERLVFQKDRHDRTVITFPDSPVKVLHLHGAVGWYRKPSVRDAYLGGGGAIPLEARTPAPIETKIAIDPIVLGDFGLYPAVDASMPDRPPDEYQVLLHPSFLKDYSGEETGNPVFIEMWRKAAESLRSADKVVIIGYSLPPADSAAWTLLLTNCTVERTTIVDPSAAVMTRYRKLFMQQTPKMHTWNPPQYFADWVKSEAQKT